MIVLKSSRELELMKEACQISAEALMVAGEAVKPGISTKEIDEIAYKFIKKCGATPNFLNYGGFPATYYGYEQIREKQADSMTALFQKT